MFKQQSYSTHHCTMLLRFLPVVLLLLTTACQADIMAPVRSELVVEGWIENGKPPIVVLTQTIPVSEEEQTMGDLGKYLVRWAKVTVSDGEKEVVLTGRYDDRYFPPFLYTTGNLMGEVGKTYRLTVEYNDFYATAETSIPSVPKVEKYTLTRNTDNDSLYHLKALLYDPPHERNYYQFFTQTNAENRHFVVAFMGTIDDALINERTEVPIYRGHQLKEVNYTPYFYLNEPVGVKCVQMDETAFRFWSAYMEAQSMNGNMFLTTFRNLPTNIQGGIGYWCGYGSTTKLLVPGSSPSTVIP